MKRSVTHHWAIAFKMLLCARCEYSNVIPPGLETEPVSRQSHAAADRPLQPFWGRNCPAGCTAATHRPAVRGNTHARTERVSGFRSQPTLQQFIKRLHLKYALPPLLYLLGFSAVQTMISSCLIIPASSGTFRGSNTASSRPLRVLGVCVLEDRVK